MILVAESGVSLHPVAAGSVEAKARTFVDTWIPICLEFFEAAAVVVLAVFCAWRAFQFGIETNWSFHGVLPLLHENWRGALFLVALFFHRAIVTAASRVRRVNVLGLEIELPQVGQTKVLDAAASPARRKK